jgi:hypothetical protein
VIQPARATTVWVVAIVAIASAWLAPVGRAGAVALTWSPPALIDAGASGESFDALSCPSAALCVAADMGGGLATTTDPGGSAPWTVTRLTAWRSFPTANSVQSLSCPAVTLCVGIDGTGDVYSTGDPTGGPGAWRSGALPTVLVGSLRSGGVGAGIACPTAGLCVVPSSDSADVYTTSDPAGGSRAWTGSAVRGSNSSQSGVACASATFCAIAAGGGLVFTSTNPAGGGATYVARHVVAATGRGAPPDITAIACPTATLCVAGDANGAVLTSTDPSSPAATWSAEPIDRGSSLAAIACRVSGVCTAIDARGFLFATAAAGAPSPGWAKVASDATAVSYVGGASTFGIACASDTLCLAADGSPNLPRSTAPTVPGTWQISPPPSDIGTGLNGVSCPSLALCVAIDADGNVLSTRTPEIAGSWRKADVDHEGAPQAISCPSRSFCLATDTFGDVIIATDPTGGVRAWRAHQIEDGEAGGNGPPTGLMGVSCVSARFCMTGDENPGDVLTATDPFGGFAAWLHHGSDGPGDGLIDASCPTVAFCGVIDSTGQIGAFTPGGSAHYVSTAIPVGLDAISCPSSGLCVAVAGGVNFNSPAGGPGGGIWSSTNPATAHPRWRRVLPDADDELAVSCHARALCLAVDVDGRVAVSLRPAAAHPHWSAAVIDPEAVFTGVSCPTSRVCFAVDSHGYLRIMRRG